MTYRIRILEENGVAWVRDMSHSQVVEYLGVPREVWKKFLSGESVTTSNGDNVKFLGWP